MCYSPFKQYQKKAIGLENYLFHSLSTMEKSKVNRNTFNLWQLLILAAWIHGLELWLNSNKM